MAYIEEIRQERFDQLTRLQRETAELARPYLVEMYAAKSRQLDGGSDRLQATADLEHLLQRMERDVVAFIDGRAEEFVALSLPVAACKELITLALRDMVERRSLGKAAYVPPAALVEQFPAELRPMLFPATSQPE